MSIDFQFVGTKTECQGLSLDPAEFAGMNIPQISAAIEKTLAEIAPGVNFFVEDVVLAAEVLAAEPNEVTAPE